MLPALIGRDRPLETLKGLVARTIDSHGGLALVEGEPGIGKTALVSHVLADARANGALVVSAACWAGDRTPGYWPWVQVVRGLQRQAGPDEWSAVAAATEPGLTFLLGEITEPPPPADYDDAAFELCDAVTTLLVNASRTRPLVIALDDLHWADAPSVRVLEFVVHHTWFEQILTVGTYRAGEVDAPEHPLRALLPPLVSRATTVTLGSLDEPEVAALIKQTTGREPSEQVVRETHRRTGGNPLFVEELARLWDAGSPLDAVPPGVRDTVQHRLELLPAKLRDLLAHAAVLGPEFSRPVVAEVASVPAAEANQLLRQAALARLVAVTESGRFAFAHDLVREILYDSTEPAERRRRHAAALRALQASGDGGVTPAHLADHAYRAVPEVSPGTATRHLITAAREAACRLAPEEARTHYLRTLDVVPADRPHRRAQIEFALGEQLRNAGDVDGARETFERVAAVADDLGEADLATRARTALSDLTGPSAAESLDSGSRRRAGFRFDGTVWTLEFAGRTAHLPDAKGLRDLHQLLSNPGIEIPATDLLAAGGTPDVHAARRMGGDPVLDETAKARYRDRLSRLDEEIERALARGSDDRAAELDSERAALLEELRDATGLAGRSRRLGDEAERSRKTVTARIRDTLRRLDDRHPELADHLRRTVSTGSSCRYQPDGTIRWQL